MKHIKRFALMAAAVTFAVTGVAFGLNKPARAAVSGQPIAADSCNNVQDVANHAWNGEAAFLVITGDKPLCQPLYVVGAAFKYVDPTPGDGRTGKWPQVLAGTSHVYVVDKPGNYIITTPAVCGQRDVYAQLGSAPIVPQYMQYYGDHEPLHLHRFSTGVVTYSSDDPATCAQKNQTFTPSQAEKVSAEKHAAYNKEKAAKERQFSHYTPAKAE